MPRMDSETNTDPLIKILLVADGMVGKTRWAGMAALAGFNVLHLNGDVGRPTMASLPLEARRRIYAIDCPDTYLSGAKDYKFLETLIAFSVGKPFKWNDTKGRVASKQINEVGDEIWNLMPSQMGSDCVVILDSWTALTESVMTASAEQQMVDLATATAVEMRGVYNPANVKANQMLQLIRSLRCHVIVLAHPDEFIKQKNPDNRTVKTIKEGDKEIEFTKMIPKSVSKPHGFAMPKYFTDMGWMDVVGKTRYLDFRVNSGRVGGGHFNDRKDSETDYSFAGLVKELGGKIPDGNQSIDHWLRIETLTEESIAASAKPVLANKNVLNPTQGEAIQVESPSGKLAGLFKK